MNNRNKLIELFIYIVIVVVGIVLLLTGGADKRLLDATGGVVQGMSGSPIVQNGRLAAVLTHVLVNDPSRGYAIFATTMLEKADAVASSK